MLSQTVPDMSFSNQQTRSLMVCWSAALFYVHQMNWLNSCNDFLTITAPLTLSWVSLLVSVMISTHPVELPMLPLPLWCPVCITLATVTRHSIVSPARNTDRRGSFAVISIIFTLRNQNQQAPGSYKMQKCKKITMHNTQASQYVGWGRIWVRFRVRISVRL